MFCLSDNGAGGVGARVNPDIDGGPFGEGGGGDHGLEPVGNLGDEGRKKFVSRCGRCGRGGSGLFRLSRVEMDLASSCSSLEAISIVEAS